MTQKTALFMSWNAPGHIRPLIGLANQLKTDDFRTIFLLIEPAAQAILDNGHELITMKRRKRINPETGEEEEGFGLLGAVQSLKEDRSLEPVETYIKTLRRLIDWGIRENMLHQEDYLEQIERIKPDLLVTDTCQLPKLRNLDYNPPWVMLSIVEPLVMYNRRKLPDGTRIPACIGAKLLKNKAAREKLQREKPDEWRAMVDEWRQIQNRMDTAGLARSKSMDKFYMEGQGKYADVVDHHYESPVLNLLAFPREISYDLEDDLMELRPRWLKCDRPMPKSIREIDPDQTNIWAKRLKEAIKGKEALIYFSLGTLACHDVELTRKFLEIFRADTKRLYVISLGGAAGKVEINSENMIGESFVPQTLILEYANLAITHGGTNTVAECYYYGVPMISLPAFQDQLDAAQRAVDLECGKRLNLYGFSALELTQAIDEVLKDEAMIFRLKDISRKIKARFDIYKVSFVLRKLVDEKALEQSFIDRCNEHEGLEFLE